MTIIQDTRNFLDAYREFCGSRLYRVHFGMDADVDAFCRYPEYIKLCKDNNLTYLGSGVTRAAFRHESGLVVKIDFVCPSSNCMITETVRHANKFELRLLNSITAVKSIARFVFPFTETFKYRSQTIFIQEDVGSRYTRPHRCLSDSALVKLVRDHANVIFADLHTENYRVWNSTEFPVVCDWAMPYDDEQEVDQAYIENFANKIAELITPEWRNKRVRAEQNFKKKLKETGLTSAQAA